MAHWSDPEATIADLLREMAAPPRLPAARRRAILAAGWVEIGMDAEPLAVERRPGPGAARGMCPTVRPALRWGHARRDGLVVVTCAVSTGLADTSAIWWAIEGRRLVRSARTWAETMPDAVADALRLGIGYMLAEGAHVEGAARGPAPGPQYVLPAVGR